MGSSESEELKSSHGTPNSSTTKTPPLVGLPGKVSIQVNVEAKTNSVDVKAPTDGDKRVLLRNT